MLRKEGRISRHRVRSWRSPDRRATRKRTRRFPPSRPCQLGVVTDRSWAPQV